MKIIICESHLQKIVTELQVSQHSQLRLSQRLINHDYYDVVAFSKISHDKILIGKYETPQDAIDIVNKTLKKLDNPYYFIPLTVSLIIKLYEFDLNEQNVTFIGSPQEQATHKEIFTDKYNWNIYLQTRPQEGENTSYGRFLVCVSIGNKITTVFLIGNTEGLLRRLIEFTKRKPTFKHIEDYAYIEDPETQLDAYIDIDALKSLQKPAEQQPQTSPQSTLSDKERRLQAYKERMKKNLRKK